MNKSPCPSRCCLAAKQLRDITIAYIEGIVVYSLAVRDYIPVAVPRGAAQEARYPVGTLGDIQAVTVAKVSIGEGRGWARRFRPGSHATMLAQGSFRTRVSSVGGVGAQAAQFRRNWPSCCQDSMIIIFNISLALVAS